MKEEDFDELLSSTIGNKREGYLRKDVLEAMRIVNLENKAELDSEYQRGIKDCINYIDAINPEHHLWRGKTPKDFKEYIIDLLQSKL